MSQPPAILIVDDKASMTRMLAKMLGDDYDVRTATSGAEAMEMFRQRPAEAVITDVRMPDMDGIAVLKAVKEESPTTEVILMTAYATVEQAVEAVKSGAYYYLTKPFEQDELKMTLAKALERRELREEARILKEQVQQELGFPNIIGQSEAMQRVFKLAHKAAEIDATVLLTGESGTGKEIFARAIHITGPRKARRFVAINCGAMPKDLIESELFGHVKGAFSGAVKDKPGLFEEAAGGTILLDEISELNVDLQVKITRVIQEREIRRVGGTKDTPVNVRIIAATNCDLKAEVDAGNFREDLYYRLHVFPIALPPLRQRQGDVPLLAEHCLKRYSSDNVELTIDPAAMQLLMSHDWPGNVREFQNALERASVLCDEGRITADLFDFLEPGQGGGGGGVPVITDLPYRDAMDQASAQFQRAYLTSVLKREGGNVTRAAQHAGVERESFHRLMRKCGVNADEIRRQK
jgi:DNA-binding NtrC family response regulator